MSCKIIELKPNNLYLNSNFEGYKLCLDQLEILKRDLDSIKIDKRYPDTGQYSYLHAKLYGLHNHLTGETINDNDSVYFVDKEWKLRKIYVDPFTNELIDPLVVFTIPRIRQTKPGDYNVSLKLVDKEFAVLSDGMGTLHILKTGTRENDNVFQIEFSDLVLNGQSFVIVHAVHKINKSIPELHILLLNIQEKENNQHQTVLNWIILNYVDNKWIQIALRRLESKGDIQYASLERSCNAVYVISENGCKFGIDAKYPNTGNHSSEMNVEKLYKWFQNAEDITVKVKNVKYNKSEIKVSSTNDKIFIQINNSTIIDGSLYQTIESDLTTWSLNADYLEINLIKSEVGLMWPELVVGGDSKGQYINDTRSSLSKNNDDSEENESHPISGITFNSEQIEECDFEFDKSLVFERIKCFSSNLTHKIHLGTQQILLSVQLDPNKSLAIGIRQDVDCCIWQPEQHDENFEMTHQGTLFAFGYIQASKNKKKFTSCSPDMETAVICESNRHLFIYKQNKPLNSGNLRNRSTGKHINNTAVQYVINTPSEEVLGLFISNKFLFLLGESYIMNIKL